MGKKRMRYKDKMNMRMMRSMMMLRMQWDNNNRNRMDSMNRKIGICQQLLLMIGAMKMLCNSSHNNNNNMDSNNKLINMDNNNRKVMRIQMMVECICKIGKAQNAKFFILVSRKQSKIQKLTSNQISF